MNKNELKKVIKPIVKECIHEVLLEEGLLSSVISEVVKGMQPDNIVLENRQPHVPAPAAKDNTTMNKQAARARKKLQEHRSNLMKAVGEDAYNGVNLFEGTAPLQNTQPQQGHADLGAPTDAGVDISSMMGGASKVWQAMK